MKKIRGQSRKLRNFSNALLDYVRDFPSEDREGCGYWHLHMPCSQSLIDSSNLPTRLRKECINSVLAATLHLHSIQPKEIDARVVCCISWPNLGDSQIIVFFGSDYFGSFFDRAGPDQIWTREDTSWIGNNLEIKIPEEFEERVFREVINDGDGRSESTQIFVGNFKPERQNKAVE